MSDKLVSITQLFAPSPLVYDLLEGFSKLEGNFVLPYKISDTGCRSTPGNATDTVSHSRLFPRGYLILGVLAI